LVESIEKRDYPVTQACVLLVALLDLPARPSGTVIYLRRTNPEGTIQVLGHRWAVDRLWVNRLVRAEVDLVANRIRCYRLRRHAPQEQPLVKTFKYVFPHKPFHPA
jgi:hypothetical protein